MARKSTVKRAERVMKLIADNYQEGVQRRSKANCVRNIIDKTDGLSYRTVMRYQKLLADGSPEDKNPKNFTIPFDF